MKKALTFVLLALLIAILFICFSDTGIITPETSDSSDDFIEQEADNNTVSTQSITDTGSKQDNSDSPSATTSKVPNNTSKNNTSSKKNDSAESRVVITTPDGTIIINPTSSTLQQIEQETQSNSSSSKVQSTIIETEEEKDIEINIEGEKEEITVTKFETDDYSVWIDKEYFKVNDADPSLVTIKAAYNSNVSMLIMKNYFGMDIAPIRYSNFLKSENLYSVSEIANAEKPPVKGTKHLTATANGKADEYLSVYFVPYDDISFTVVLSCPTEAIEGYGTRMERLFREIDFK